MERSMLVDICDYNKDWGSIVEIAANSGIQFLDFHFDSNSLRGFESDFVEDQNENGKVVLSKIDADSHSEHEVQYSISSQDILSSYLADPLKRRALQFVTVGDEIESHHKYFTNL